MDRYIDRRTFRRFKIVLPVLFRWTDGEEHYQVGHSANVGMGGMFILTSQCPPVGTRVEVEFVIPAFDGVQRQLRFCCGGDVARVEACYQVTGFAVAGRIDNAQQEDRLEDLALDFSVKH